MRYACIGMIVAASVYAQDAKGGRVQPSPKRDTLSAKRDILPAKEVILTPAAEEAARLAGNWNAGSSKPILGSNGKVTFLYGSEPPVIVCAPLRVCVLQLPAGERITIEPQIGDAVRWGVTPAWYGEGPDRTETLVIKPHSPGLDTNMVITTDRRPYYVRLVSKPDDYVPMTEIVLPPEEKAKWKEYVSRLPESGTTLPQRPQPDPIRTEELLNFNYVVTGGSESLRPIRVFDNGTKTYLRMPADIRNREAPVFVVVGPGGKEEVTNYRVNDTKATYIVDRLFDHARLILGNGKKVQKVDITRTKERS
jgi:type IV secretion system protein TrbG